MAQKLSNAYVDPSQPGSLGGVAKFAKAHGLTQSKARQVLETMLSYTLHKPRRRQFPTLPVIVFKVDQQWVMDLMDVQKLAKWNKGHRYILTVVDVLSKYAWAIPIKNKTGAVMVQALQTLWKQASPRQPQRVQSDDGTEFMNAKVQAFFKKHQVDHFSTQGDTKAALAEMLIKTLKTRLYRYFTAANTLTYLKALPLIVEQYNHTVHSSIQEKPAHVTPDNEYLIWNRLYRKRLRKRARPKLRVGDKVRLNKKHRVFQKGYLPGWTEEVFLVHGISTIRPVVTYTLTEWNGTPIKGTFYEEDVQKVLLPDEALFRVEKVLKRKGNQVFVAWKGWPKQYNSWIWKKDLQVL